MARATRCGAPVVGRLWEWRTVSDRRVVASELVLHAEQENRARSFMPLGERILMSVTGMVVAGSEGGM